MQPLRIKKKSHNLLGQKKITQPLGTKKITQPLGTTKKSHTLLGQKKLCNLSEHKKIKQSFDKNNHATLRGKKIMEPLGTKKRNLSGQKNHATSRDKKMTQPLGSKNITQPLRTKKSCNLSRKKNHVSIGPIVSKLVHWALNCSKWHQIGPNWSK